MSIKYLLDGTEVEVIEKTQNGYLVRWIYEGDEDDIPDPNICFVDKVFDEVPTLKHHSIIKQLTEDISRLRQTRGELEEQIRKFKADNKNWLEKCANYPEIKYLDDFVNNRITHYVEVCYSGAPEIHEWADAKADDDYQKEFKLLVLFGTQKRDLNWKLNRYSDGSGGHTHIYPCVSYEDALKKSQELIDKVVAESMEHPRERVIQSAWKYNLEIDDKYIATFKDQERARTLKEISNLEKNLSDLKSKMEVPS